MSRCLAFFVCLLCCISLRAQDSTPSPADVNRAVERLNETPVFLNFTTQTVKDIYVRGQALGIRAQVFTTVGDSDTTQGGFLRPIGMGSYPGFYCDLGEYSALQEAIDYYSAVSPLPQGNNSFNNESIMAHKGFSTYSILDYMWAESDLCIFGELPLECEYRVVQPGTAIIMLGLMDIQYFTVDEYKANMAQIIEKSIDAGVIPVLTTFVVMKERTTDKLDWGTSVIFNDALVDLAEAYDIPLINLWREAQLLPDQGIGLDETHLNYPVGEFCKFTGSEHLYGGTLRNLLTLTGLDVLRREVFEAEE